MPLFDPVTVGDDAGLFGADSMTWQVHSHPIMLVGGVRALMMQSLHPLAMAGVDQHSGYREDPVPRLLRTAEYVLNVTFGDVDTAERCGELVRKVHAFVKGTDPVTGESYSAEDPETLLWVHVCEADSFTTVYSRYVKRLHTQELDRYYAESAKSAALVGIPEELVPRSAAAVQEYYRKMRPRLFASEVAMETVRFVLSPPAPLWQKPGMPLWHMISHSAVATIPNEYRRMCGIHWSRPYDYLTGVWPVWAATKSFNATLGTVVPLNLVIKNTRRLVDQYSFHKRTPAYFRSKSTK